MSLSQYCDSIFLKKLKYIFFIFPNALIGSFSKPAWSPTAAGAPVTDLSASGNKCFDFEIVLRKWC
jgi:hypothetical protein